MHKEPSLIPRPSFGSGRPGKTYHTSDVIDVSQQNWCRRSSTTIIFELLESDSNAYFLIVQLHVGNILNQKAQYIAMAYIDSQHL